MTFEEQIWLIELKELSAEDERQVYSQLVCILHHNRIDDADGSDNSFKDTKEQSWKHVESITKFKGSTETTEKYEFYQIYDGKMPCFFCSK
jgi:hypothetical protein